MEYESRITCFIDVLGFKSAINQSVQDDKVRNAIYENIRALDPSNQKGELYKRMRSRIQPGGSDIPEDVLRQACPLQITQFSDSFVLSCPSINFISCEMLLEAIYSIHVLFYSNLGMMVRGGISLGKLVHAEDGALFGPAMNDAYALESRKAIYPRVLISHEAHHCLLKHIKKDHPILKPLRTAFDGHYMFDLVSILTWPGCADRLSDPEYTEKQLNDIEKDILENSPEAHPKIAYLLDRWFTEKMSFSKTSQPLST